MAGQMTDQKLWKLSDYNAGGTDLNNLQGDCQVYVANSPNMPSGTTGGICIQFAYGEVYKTQFFNTGTEMYNRVFSNTKWSSWKALA